MSTPTRARITLPPRYRVGRYIAGGGMASVWTAEDVTLGRTVAVKVMAAYLLEEPTAAERFDREARAAARVSSHPHVVTIYDVGEHAGRPFIVMELVEGGTVADRIKAGKVKRASALRWLRDAASALDAAHELGIVHRDVKPANLLLDTQEHALVADFGVARLLSEATVTVTGEVLGTAAYLSPEHITGDPVTAAADRYSLGVVAYELLTGTRPFTAEHLAAQARQHIEEEPDPPTARDPALPPALDAVLARALAKAPAERWPTCIAMVDAIEVALAPRRTRRSLPRPLPPSTPGSLPRPLPRSTPGSPPRRLPRPSARTGALLALAAAAGLAAVLLSGGSGPPARQAAHTAPAHRAATRTTPASPATLQALAASQAHGYALIHSGLVKQGLALEQSVLSDLSRHGFSVARCREPTGGCLTFAFALFDIGHALRLQARYADARRALEQRLLIDNAKPTVQAEIDALPAG